MNSHFALTFDDGPGPQTATLLDHLERFDIRVTFFVLGENIETPHWCRDTPERARDVVTRQLNAGHVVGNHCYRHWTSSEADADIAGFAEDVDRCEVLIRQLRARAGLAVDEGIPFRLPFGPQPVLVAAQPPTYRQDPRFQAVAAIGKRHTHWTATFQDWLPIPGGPPAFAAKLVDHVEEKVRNGQRAVLLLHDGIPGEEATNYASRHETVEAVALFLEEGRRREWGHFVVRGQAPCASGYSEG
jgi:peptidoglycan/xylan/chitin deacetylase (PgdA/CDA1 family)